MKPSLRSFCLAAACSAFALRLVSAPATPDVLRERYVAGLAVIADVQATTSRTGQMLDLIERGAETQAARVSTMEDRLLVTRQQADYFDRQIQSLGGQTTRLLEQKHRIDTRFSTLDRSLADDRTLLAKSTEAVGALVASAEKSGAYVERTIAEAATEELKHHARQLRDLVDRLAQARQRAGLERTLFEGLQPRLTAAANDLKGLNADLGDTNNNVVKLRDSLGILRGGLERDRASLAKQYQAFGLAVEGFRVTQADVLRRWLLSGPPAGDLPSLSIDDIVESGLVESGYGGKGGSAIDPVISPNAMAAHSPTQRESAPGMADAEKGGQVSAEFTQLNRRVRWFLSMLERLEQFAEESLGEAEGWNMETSRWRVMLTNLNRSIADGRGQLTSLQMEQDMVATTIKLIGQQSSDTTESVANAAKHIAAQAAQLTSLTAELKRLSAN